MTTPAAEQIDSARTWHVQWTCDKWSNASAFQQGQPADESLVVQENLLLNGGIGLLLHLLVGASGAFAYNAANSYLKVGDSATAAAASQTDLQAGANFLSQAMDATYPQVAAQTVTWRATFGTGDANFDWLEAGVINGSGAVSASTVLLNRKIVSFGVKFTNNIWQLTCEITIS